MGVLKVKTEDGFLPVGVGGSGITAAEKALILSLFKNAAYTADMSATISRLESLWSGYGDVPDVPDVPDEPDVPVAPVYTVTNNLTGVTNSNAQTEVTEGDSYSANLTVEAQKEMVSVTVTMGGEDITDTAYGDGYIIISKVTGDIVITAVASGVASMKLVQRTLSGEYTNDRVTSVGSYAFCGCKKLTSVKFQNALEIKDQAFRECSAITAADFQSVTKTGTSAMYACNALSSINFPALTTPGSEWIRRAWNATHIPYAVFPSVVNAGTWAFKDSHIDLLDLPVCSSIGNQALANAVYGLILRNDTVCTLSATTGTLNLTAIYVPRALVDSYKGATNWSAYADKFRAIEDYPDICEVN